MKRVAVSIPVSLFKLIEKERQRTGESRSAIVRRAILSLTEENGPALPSLRYSEGYLRNPETEEEIAGASAAAARLFSEEQ